MTIAVVCCYCDDRRCGHCCYDCLDCGDATIAPSMVEAIQQRRPCGDGAASRHHLGVHARDEPGNLREIRVR